MYNTISQLQRIVVKPLHWLAYPQSAQNEGEKGYKLLFCHIDSDDLATYCPVMSARGRTKIYKTLEALCKDVYEVDQKAQVIVIPKGIHSDN